MSLHLPHCSRIYQVFHKRNSQKQTDTSDPFTEEELLAVYEDLLANPSHDSAEPTAVQSISPEERSRNIVQALHERLLPARQESDLSAVSQETTLSDTLRSRRAATSAQPAQHLATTETRSLNPLLIRLEEIVVSMEAVQNLAPATSVPLGVLAHQEWEALVDVYILDRNGEAMEHALDLMKVRVLMRLRSCEISSKHTALRTGHF